MRSPRRTVAPALAAVGLLALAACGDSATPAADTGVPRPAGSAAASDATTELPPPDAAPPTADDEPPATDPAPSEPDPIVTDPGPPDSLPATEGPPATDAPRPATDAAVEPAVLGGRVLAETVAAGSDIASNPLPDLVVDDVRRGAAINLRNVFPADRPVLLWFWAPH